MNWVDGQSRDQNTPWPGDQLPLPDDSILSRTGVTLTEGHVRRPIKHDETKRFRENDHEELEARIYIFWYEISVEVAINVGDASVD